MANLTITIDDGVLRQARIRALEEGTSVNALLRAYLEHYTHVGQPYRQATNAILELARRSTAASQGRHWSRDEL